MWVYSKCGWLQPIVRSLWMLMWIVSFEQSHFVGWHRSQRKYCLYVPNYILRKLPVGFRIMAYHEQFYQEHIDDHICWFTSQLRWFLLFLWFVTMISLKLTQCQMIAWYSRILSLYSMPVDPNHMSILHFHILLPWYSRTTTDLLVKPRSLIVKPPVVTCCHHVS